MSTPSPSPTTHRVGLLLLAVAIAALGSAAIGGAQTADFATNETIELTNDTEPITVSVTWNDSITDEATTAASVTFYNESEYANDSANATVALEESLQADAGNTTEAEFNQTDAGLDLGDEYRVVLTGDSAAIDSASIDDSSGFLGGVVPGVDGLEVAVVPIGVYAHAESPPLS